MSTSTSYPSNTRHCTQCGDVVESDTRFCGNCGAPIGTPTARVPSTQKVIPPTLATVPSGNSANDETADLEALVALHPEDESYQKLLAIQLHDDAMKDWWKDPKSGSLLCTTLQQIKHARKQLDRAASLHFNDPALRASLDKLRRTVDSQEVRSYTGNWFQIVLLGLFYFIPGYIWWYVNRRPEFLQNRDYMKYQKTGKEPGAFAKMGGSAEKVSNFFDTVTGGWGFIFAFIFMFICSPIMMWLAYKENYVEVKKEYESA